MVNAKKSLGQNFLKDKSVLQKIVEAAELKPDDTVLEIGPGKGALTEELLKHVNKLIAVELDQRLIPWLKAQFSSHRNYALVHGDALKHTPPGEPYKIVANIPYYITSPLLNHYLLDQFQGGNPPELIVFMVQREVAEKLIAKDGRESVLSLQVKLFGDPELICIVPPQAFEPRPKVDSAVIKIRVAKSPRLQGDLKKIIRLFHVSFAQKRKKLSNNLAAILQKKPGEVRTLLEKLQINPELRAEALTWEDWQKLANELN